jgi:hypothetical protein
VPLRGGDIPGHCLRDHAAGLDLEASYRELLQLVVCRLAGGGDAEVGEGARHGRISSKIVQKGCPELTPCSKPRPAIF